MTIYSTIIDNWLFVYWNLLYYSLLYYFVIFWFWLTHVDRIHLREKSKSIGRTIQNNLSKQIPKQNQMLIDYCYKQTNAIGEILAGISDGLLNKESVINVCIIKNSETQTLLLTDTKETQNDLLLLDTKEMQTDIFENENINIANDLKFFFNNDNVQNVNNDVNNILNEYNIVDQGKESSSDSDTETSLPKKNISTDSEEIPKEIPKKVIKRIFTKPTQNKLDSEIFKNDMEEDKKIKKEIGPKARRIYIKKT